MSKIYTIYIFYDHHDRDRHADLPVPELMEMTVIRKSWPFLWLLLDENEEMVRQLIENKVFMSLDDPRLHYNLVLQVFEQTHPSGSHFSHYHSVSKPVSLQEGQTLASTHLTHFVMDEAEKELEGKRKQEEGKRVLKEAQALSEAGISDPYRKYRELYNNIDKPTRMLFCSASIEIRDVTPPENFLASPTASMIEFISSIVTIVTSPITVVPVLIAVLNHWSKKDSMSTANSQESSSQPSEPDILAIRLQMTDRTEATFQEWLTDPARLKHYIDIFLRPSPSAKPVQVAFALNGGDTIFVDVTEGAQNNLQLNEVLSYLHIDLA